MATKKSFETSLSELQEIINEFQSGDIALDNSVKLYKKAITLIDYCQKELDKAKLEVGYIDVDKDLKDEE